MVRTKAADATRIQDYLTGVKYPAGKQDIVNTAKNNNAPIDVIRSLESLPDREFRRPTELNEMMASRP